MSPKTCHCPLKGLENTLKVGEFEKSLGRIGDVNLYDQMIGDAEGLEKIGNLQSHDNNEIYKALKLLKPTGWKMKMRHFLQVMVLNLVSFLESTNFQSHLVDSTSVEDNFLRR